MNHMNAGKLPRKLLVAGVLMLALGIPASAGADTFTVTNGGNSGSGSLRQAVLDANAHPGRDKIDFAPAVDHVIVSNPGDSDLEITDDLDIEGPGAGKLALFGFSSRVFDVRGSVTATIAGLCIKFGGAFGDAGDGGAILNAGNLMVTGVTFEDNHAKDTSGRDVRGGAIANSGTLSLRNSLLTKNGAVGGLPGKTSGGAIFNSGTMTIDGSRLTANVASSAETTGPDGGDGRGGAIANTGDLRISDSTLSGNLARGGTAHLEGGAGLGGAIYNYDDGTLSVGRSSLAHNSAAGGGASVGGGGVAGLAIGGGIENFGTASFQLENVTLAANDATSFGEHRQTQSFGGGIDNQATTARSFVLASTISGNSAYEGSNIDISSANLSLQDTILANPTNQAHEVGENCGHPRGVPSLPPIDSRGYNLDSDSSCELKGRGDQASRDPQLKDLDDNGGPTQTMAIPLSSPALDAGVSAGLTTDQRGERRPVIVPGVPRPEGGDGADIGAYEYQPSHRGHLQIQGTVKPGRTHAGERTCFKLKAEHPNGGPLAKAQVKLGGKRTRTDERGKATICKRFKHKGVRHPRIRKRGLERAKLRVNVRP